MFTFDPNSVGVCWLNLIDQIARNESLHAQSALARGQFLLEAIWTKFRHHSTCPFQIITRNPANRVLYILERLRLGVSFVPTT